MRTFALVVSMLCLAVSQSVAAYDWKYYNGHQYAITENYGSWLDCQNEAVAAGGHLVVIEDDAENAWVSSVFAGYYTRTEQPGQADYDRSLVWIGLSRPQGEAQLLMGESNWSWVTGEPLVQTSTWPHWFAQEGHGGIHVYLHTDTHFQPRTWWEDTPYDQVYDFYARGVIEAVPEPTTLSLLALGGLLLARRRRL